MTTTTERVAFLDRGTAAEAIRDTTPTSETRAFELVALDGHQALRLRRRAPDWRSALLPPRTPYRRVTPTTTLPAGITSLDLLDRDERL